MSKIRRMNPIDSHLTAYSWSFRASVAADVGRPLLWKFDNVKPLAETMFIRFKYDIFPNPPDSQVYSLWLAGDDQYIQYGEQPDTPIYEQSHKHAARTFHEVEFPA